MAEARRSDDLTAGRAALWLWRLPTLMIVVGAFWPAGRLALWIPAFLVAGAGCVANARRCGRVHCYVTGPLYLGAGLYLLGSLLAPLPFQPWWFLGLVVGLSAAAQLGELFTGRFTAPSAAAAGDRSPWPSESAGGGGA